MAVVNCSRYINYCEICMNCITSKSSKLKYWNFVHFSTTIFCFKFNLFAGWRGDKQLLGLGWGHDLQVCGGDEGQGLWWWGVNVDSVVGTGRGWGQCCRNRVGMWDEQLAPCSSLLFANKIIIFTYWRYGRWHEYSWCHLCLHPMCWHCHLCNLLIISDNESISK